MHFTVCPPSPHIQPTLGFIFLLLSSCLVRTCYIILTILTSPHFTCTVYLIILPLTNIERAEKQTAAGSNIVSIVSRLSCSSLKEEENAWSNPLMCYFKHLQCHQTFVSGGAWYDTYSHLFNQNTTVSIFTGSAIWGDRHRLCLHPVLRAARSQLLPVSAKDWWQEDGWHQ